MGEDWNSYSILITLSIIFTFLLFGTKSRPKIRLPPGPPSLPVIGHLHLLRSPVHHSIQKLAHRYGPLFYLRFGSKPCVVASSPDIVKELLKTQELSFCNRPASMAVQRFDLPGFAFVPYGPYFKFVKKLCMSELLGGQTVDQLQPIRRKELLKLMQTFLEKSRSGDAVDVSSELIKMAINIITGMTASKTPSGNGGEMDEARKLVKQVAELIGTYNLADYIWFLKNTDFQGLKKKIEEVHRGFDAWIEGIMKEKEEVKRWKKEKGDAEDGVKDFLDILLGIYHDEKAEIKITRENIKGCVLDIFTAGSDTSASSLEWALSELINQPAMLEKARKELDLVIGKDRIAHESDIVNLPYLQAIVKETLRLHPALPLASRESTKDTKVGGYDIPANTRLLVNIWALGRDPDYWNDPLEFRPDRFMAEDKNGHDSIDVRGQNFNLLPFGTGRRVCPGISLTLQTIHVTLAAMLQCFEWKVGGGDGRGDGTVDLTEGTGLVIGRAHPLICVPVARFDPFPSAELRGEISLN